MVVRDYYVCVREIPRSHIDQFSPERTSRTFKQAEIIHMHHSKSHCIRLEKRMHRESEKGCMVGQVKLGVFFRWWITIGD